MEENIYYKHEKDGFNPFIERIQNTKLAIIFDKNTQKFEKDFLSTLKNDKNIIKEIFFDEDELCPDEIACDRVIKEADGYEYCLAVGSGSLNDIAKYSATQLKIPSGILATAASMDGYLSKVSSLLIKKYKKTIPVNSPKDVLIDLDIALTAPKILTASGFGDIIGKFNCLTDWKLSHLLTGEEINKEAYDLMEKALKACVDSFNDLKNFGKEGIDKLMNALLMSGRSISICGNSRPASGAEHHFSHFLEMDFAKRGEKIPPHGIKVALGCLITNELYHFLKKKNFDIPKKEEVYKLIDALPNVEYIIGMMKDLGAPLRMSEIGVRKETFLEMLENAYKIRDRFTILTLYNKYNLWDDEIRNYLVDKYF